MTSHRPLRLDQCRDHFALPSPSTASPAPPSPGGCARCPAGATSCRRERVLSEMQGARPGRHRVRPARLPRGRCRVPRRPARGVRPRRRSAASTSRSCTTPATTRCPASTRSSTSAWPPRPAWSCSRPARARTATTPGPELDETGWQTLLANLDRIADHAASRGVEASLHPHMGTMIESGAETPAGHRGLAHRPLRRHRPPRRRGRRPRRDRRREPGPGPARAPQGRRQRAGRAGRGRLADLRRRGPRGHVRAARHGSTWTSPGSSTTLETAGYQGWYVLEQDVMLPGEPDGEGPVADVRAVPQPT